MVLTTYDRRNASGETALGYACEWGHLRVVGLLVDAGVDVNAVEHSPEHGVRNTALDCCARHPEIAEYVRTVGAQSIVDIEGTPSRLT
jgi:ankyrin repeat protein